MRTEIILSMAAVMAVSGCPAIARAQTVTSDSVQQHVSGRRLSIGGYGEVALTRNFSAITSTATAVLKTTGTTRATAGSTFLMPCYI